MTGCILHYPIAIKVICISLNNQTGLLQIIDTRNTLGSLPGFIQRREQHGRENRDDRYYNEQLNKGKWSKLFHFQSFLLIGL